MASDPFVTTVNPLAFPWGTAGGGWNNLRGYPLCGNAAGSDDNAAMRFTTSVSLLSVVTYDSGTFDGGAAFLDPSGNGYISTFYDGANGEIYVVTAGPNYSQVGTNFPATFVAGDTQGLGLDGNDLVCYKNGVEIARRTNATFRTGLNPAIFAFAGNLRFRAWTDGVVDLTPNGFRVFRGPGVPMERTLYFLPQQFGAQGNMPNDTSLQSDLQSVSTVTADLTAIGKTGFIQLAGPGIGPDYNRLFVRQRFGAESNMPNDTSLASNLASISAVTAALSTAIPLQSSLASVSSLTVALSTAIPLQSSLASISSLSAALSTSIILSSSLQSVSSVTGALTTAIALQTALQSLATVSSSLTTSISLQSALAAVSTLSASLTTAITLQATLSSVSTVNATLDGSAAALQAALASVASVTAALTTAVRLSANLSSQAAVSASLSTSISLQTALAAVSSVSATLTSSITQFQANLQSSSSASASLTTSIRLQSALASVSTLTAELSGTAAQLQASLVALSSVTGQLSDAVEPIPFAPVDQSAWQMEGLPLLNNAYCNVPPSLSRGLQARGDIPIGRFGWIDLAAGNIGYHRPRGESIAAIVGQFYSFTQAIYFDRGLVWIRSGYPVTAYSRGDFIIRFPGGALAGDRVYASVLDGSPVSGYAVNTLPTQWRVMRSAGPWVPTIISSWEFIQ